MGARKLGYLRNQFCQIIAIPSGAGKSPITNTRVSGQHHSTIAFPMAGHLGIPDTFRKCRYEVG
jgi:hypothetical protein